jgi:predicted transcriptional regulator of viral defense system
MEIKDTYLDTLSIMDSLKDYASPKSKLTTMIKSGEVIRIRRGLYIAGGNILFSVKTLANKIYGPSYISFEYALSYYGFIPERVENVTSAIFNKNKNKIFDTPVGTFFYQSVPASVYYLGVTYCTENGHPFFMATKEKALCDTIYKCRKIESYNYMSELIYEDLRIDHEILTHINIDVIEELSRLYRRRIVLLFVKWIKKEFGDG